MERFSGTLYNWRDLQWLLARRLIGNTLDFVLTAPGYLKLLWIDGLSSGRTHGCDIVGSPCPDCRVYNGISMAERTGASSTMLGTTEDEVLTGMWCRLE
jgi:hypothetical protein